MSTGKNNANPKKNAQVNGPMEVGDAGNIDQIRDILFGKNMKGIERKIVQLEENVELEISSIREETKKMFNSIESYVKEEVKTLLNQIKTEKTQRTEGEERLTEKIDKLSRKLTEFGEETQNAQRELRDQLLEQSKKLSEEIISHKDEVMKILKRKTDSLEDKKVERSILATLFNQMALDLSDNSDDSDLNNG